MLNSDPDLEEAVWFLTRLEKVRAAGRMLCSRAAFRSLPVGWFGVDWSELEVGPEQASEIGESQGCWQNVVK